MLELDPEHDILEAFACFDDGDKGWVDIKEMRKHLGEIGDRMEDWEVSLDSRQIIHVEASSFGGLVIDQRET